MCYSKPTCHRFVFDDEPKPDSVAENPARLSFWKPFSLRFEKDIAEEAFHCRTRQTWQLHDLVAHSLTILHVLASLLEIAPKIQAWYTVLVFSVLSCFASLQIYAEFKHRHVQPNP